MSFYLQTSLQHLPEAKQQQLREIAELLRQSRLKIYYLILFGSYARGDWVEDAENRYFSDYDLLVVTTAKDLKKTRRWANWEKQAQAIAGHVPLTVLFHALGYVNEELRLGNYFFGDILKEGIALYQCSESLLNAPHAANLTPQERLTVANRNLHHWFNSASGFWHGCGYFMARHQWAHAAFLLHQSVERYYHTVTLVDSGYKHKNHDIAWLADLGATLHPALLGAMLRVEEADKARFELLRRAYIDARYSDDYRITEEELTALREQVRDLAIRVRQACGELLGRFCGMEAVAELGKLPKAPDYSAALELPPLPESDDLEAVKWWGKTVWSEAKEEGKAVGLAEGREVGKAEGLVEGEARGEERGLVRGREVGLTEGREAEQRRIAGIARSLLAKGMADPEIAEITGLSLEEIAALRSCVGCGER